MKKIVSVLLAATVAVSSAALFAGCKDDEYPVEVANYTIEKEPQNVVVLDAAAADIMSYIGYDRKFSGRSASVDQKNLSAAPEVGTDSNPNIAEIESLNADVVFSNDNLSDLSRQKLEDKGIKVINLQQPQATTEVKTNYETMGKILGGKITGLKEGKDAYDKLITELEGQKREIEGLSGTGALNTICYLYVEDGKLKQLTNGSFGNILLGYTNCVNIGVNIDQNIVDPVTLASADPTYVVYDNEDTLNIIKTNKMLAKLSALKNGKSMALGINNMSRPGQTAVDTLKILIDFIYEGKKATADEAATTATAATQPATKAAEGSKTETKATQPATTQPATQPATTQPATQPQTKATEPAAKSVASEYGDIDLNGLSLEKDDDNDDVKQMQQRLEDLGYLNKADENVTGYYGEVTEQAIKDFQKNNGLPVTGEADNKTLQKLFMSDAKKK